MYMLDKVRLSIVRPEGLVKYRKDSIFKAIFYTLFFALFMATTTVVDTVSFDGLSPAARAQVREEMAVQSLPCEIVDARLSCDENVSHTFYEEGLFQIHLNSGDLSLNDYTGNQYHFVIQDERVALVFMNMVIRDKAISELDSSLHNLDFTLDTQSETDIKDALILGIEQELTQTRVYWGSVLVVSRIFTAMLLFHFFILINTLLLRGRLRVVPFKQLYVMLSYASTLLYVILIFDSMIALNFFFFIVLLFIAFRQTSRLALDIQRRVQYNVERHKQSQLDIKEKSEDESGEEQDEELNEDSLNEDDEDDHRF